MKETYHFLGIGGIGMSALAHILLDKGVSVSGQDQKKAHRLTEYGVTLTKELPKQATIVYSTAFKSDHPSMALAKKKGLPLIHRSILLGSLLKKQCALLITGTHGKTSTSALLSWVLLSAGLKPTYAVGGILRNLNKNGGYGIGPHFVAEADESDGSFLNYSGNGAIITNIDKDHLNYWKTEENLILGFQKFISNVKDQQLLFWCNDDPILKKLSPPGISYGKSGALCMKRYSHKGITGVFTATFRGVTYDEIEIPLIGEKNALNALAVFGMALQLGVSDKKIREAFTTYKGVNRRMERIGEVNRVTIYDDYAHHPTEICVVLSALKKAFGKRRLITVFQPHRYTRSEELDFCGAFAHADLAILTDIYSAGETPIKGVNGLTFYKKLKANNTIYLQKKMLPVLLSKILIPGDVLVTLGAGDIREITTELIG